MFTSTDIQLIISGLVLLAAQIGTQIVNIIVARRANKQSVQNALDIAEVNTKAEVIVGHVNSEKTAAQGREALLAREVEILRELLAEKKQAAALLAQAATSAQPVTVAPMPVQVVNQPDDPVPTTAFKQPK